jgi:aminocarboxymuconate-semialdehyde decarboxylase
MKGVATNTHVNRRYFDHPSLWPFLEAAADLDVPVFFHPSDVVGVDRMDRFHLIQMIGNPHDATFALVRTILGGVLDRIPHAKLCFVQVGGSLPAVIGRIDHTWQVREEARENTERPPSEYLPRLFYDSIAHSPEPIEILLRHVPDTQILMGSDYPWDMGEIPGESIRALPGASPTARARMLGGNAAGLLRLEGP